MLDRYRGPLLSAASELADRIDNVRTRDFARVARAGSGQDDWAKLSTLFRVAQYLGWREVLRTEVQLLRFENESDTRLTATLLGDIVWAFASQSVDGGRGAIWAEEQRGIGELMTLRRDDGLSVCKGYASFTLMYEDQLGRWMDRLATEWLSEDAIKSDRLRLIQLGLFGLVLQLDEEGAHLHRAWIEQVRTELAQSPTPTHASRPERRLTAHVRGLVNSREADLDAQR